MSRTIGIEDRLWAVAVCAAFAIFLLVIALSFQSVLSLGDRKKHIYGHAMCWWVAVTFVFCTSLGLMLSHTRFELRSAGISYGGIGVFLGILIGHFHGNLLINRYLLQLKSEADTPTEPIDFSNRLDAANPYAPPLYMRDRL